MADFVRTLAAASAARATDPEHLLEPDFPEAIHTSEVDGVAEPFA